MAIGLTIRELRIKRNLQQKDLAERLGVVVGTISSYETENSQPNIEKLIQLSEIFDVSVDFLVSNPRLEKYKTESNKDVIAEPNDIQYDFLNQRISDLQARLKDKEDIIDLLKLQAGFSKQTG